MRAKPLRVLVLPASLALAILAAPSAAGELVASQADSHLRQPPPCLPERGKVEPPRVGPLRLSRTRRTLRRHAGVAPARRRAYELRWCTEGSDGRLSAVFGRRSGGTSKLLVTTAPGYRIAGVGPGEPLRAFRRRFPDARHIGGGVYRAGPASTLFFGVRRGGTRVRYVGAATGRVLRSRRLRERYLTRAGLR